MESTTIAPNPPYEHNWKRTWFRYKLTYRGGLDLQIGKPVGYDPRRRPMIEVAAFEQAQATAPDVASLPDTPPDGLGPLTLPSSPVRWFNDTGSYAHPAAGESRPFAGGNLPATIITATYSGMP